MTALGALTDDVSDDAIRIPSGVECISIVARHHGLHISAAQTTLDNHLSGAELSAEEIAHCAARAGTESQARSTDLARLVPSEEVASRHRDADERREHGSRGAGGEATKRPP